jgi:hypothetical protein
MDANNKPVAFFTMHGSTKYGCNAAALLQHAVRMTRDEVFHTRKRTTVEVLVVVDSPLTAQIRPRLCLLLVQIWEVYRERQQVSRSLLNDHPPTRS